MTRSLLVAVIAVSALYPCISKTQTLQDAIKEACTPGRYTLPCGNEITLEELNSRLQYKMKMMEEEDHQMKSAMSFWQKNLGLLYSEPTQRVWDSLKNMAMPLSTDLIGERLSKTIDGMGVAFLINANGNPDVVRERILWYMVNNNILDRERAEILKGLTAKVEPKYLFHVEPPHQ